MITIHFQVHELDRAFELHRYFLTSNIPAHRMLVSIVYRIIGSKDIFAFEAEAAQNWETVKIKRSSGPLVHICGGSTYNAHLSAAEARGWIDGLVARMQFPMAVTALHFGLDGRLDFHVLVINADGQGRKLDGRKWRRQVRECARALTEELNLARLKVGKMTIGNLDRYGQVYFLTAEQSVEPEKVQEMAKIEPSAGTLAPAVATVSPSAESPPVAPPDEKAAPAAVATKPPALSHEPDGGTNQAKADESALKEAPKVNVAMDPSIGWDGTDDDEKKRKLKEQKDAEEKAKADAEKAAYEWIKGKFSAKPTGTTKDEKGDRGQEGKPPQQAGTDAQLTRQIQPVPKRDVHEVKLKELPAWGVVVAALEKRVDDKDWAGVADFRKYQPIMFYASIGRTVRLAGGQVHEPTAKQKASGESFMKLMGKAEKELTRWEGLSAQDKFRWAVARMSRDDWMDLAFWLKQGDQGRKVVCPEEWRAAAGFLGDGFDRWESFVRKVAPKALEECVHSAPANWSERLQSVQQELDDAKQRLGRERSTVTPQPGMNRD